MSYQHRARDASTAGTESAGKIDPGKTTRSGRIFRRAADGDGRGVAPDAAAAVDRAAGSSGAALPAGLQERFGGSLDADLSGVRLHTGADSAAAADAVGAKAYTIGNDIHFGAGHFDPSSSDGLLLIAHEVAHTVQQGGGTPMRQHKLEVSQAGDPLEHEADRAAEAMVAGRSVTVQPTGSAIARLARKEEESPEEEEVPAKTVTELRTLNHRATVGLPPLVKAGGQASAITAAIAAGDAKALGTAAAQATAGLGAAEKLELQIRNQLKTYSGDVQEHEAYQAASRSHQALDKGINQHGTAILSAFALPGAKAAEGGGGDGGDGGGGDGGAGDTLAAAAQARLTAVQPAVTLAGSLKATAKAAAAKKGKPRLEACQPIRTRLLGAPGDQRGYVMSVLKGAGIPGDITSYLEGNGAELEKAAAAPALGSGGDASGEAQKPGAVSAGKPIESPNSAQAVAGKDGEGKLESGNGTSTTYDPHKGEVGFKGEKELSGGGKLEGGASVDFQSDDGKLRFEGAKFEAGYTMPGGKKVSAEGGYTRSISPPSFDGTKWFVAYTCEYSGGGGLGATKGPASGSGKAGYAQSRSGTKVFTTPEAAKAFYEAGELGPTDYPDAAGVASMTDGESITISHNVDGGVSGSVGHIGVSVGGGINGGGGTESKMTKKPGNKVQVTVRDYKQIGASGSISGPGVGGGAGGGTATSTSVTVEFDLNNPAGQAAYAAWQANPTQEPKGAGVKVLSRGEGSAESGNVGVSVLWAGGQSTSTTGEFTEKTADGKHAQKTIVGTHTDATKDLDLEKRSRSDSLEITQLDKEDPTYTIKTTIDAKDSAQATNAELAKTIGGGYDQSLEHTGGKASGKWQVESSYSKKQMDEFAKKVKDGSFRLSAGAMEAGQTHAAELQAALNKPGLTEEQKQKALAEWFSQQGPKAMADLRNAVGEPDMAITLENDPYMTGAAGQAQFDGKMKGLEDRLLDPKLDAEGAKKVLMDLKAVAADEGYRKRHVANPSNYKDLPDYLRGKVVGTIQANLQRAAQLEQKINTRLGELGVDVTIDKNSPLGIELQWVARLREAMVDHRATAVMHRRMHDGQGSVAKTSARGELHRQVGIPELDEKQMKEMMARGKLDGNDRVALYRATYKLADAKWAEGEKLAKEGEIAEQAVLKMPTFNDGEKAAAASAAKACSDKYGQAKVCFEKCSELMVTMTRDLRNSGELKKELAGYNHGHQNDFWIAME